jgi:hypothetical protein
MIGIVFLGVIALGLFAAFWLARRVLRWLPPGKFRAAATGALAATFVVVPLADEILGGFQLRSLCAKSSLFTVDAEKIKGKKVRVSTEPANKEVAGTSIRILYSRSSYRDIETNEELASSGWYVANGGWLIRTLAMTNGITPLTIFPSSCSGEKRLADYDFTLVK